MIFLALLGRGDPWPLLHPFCLAGGLLFVVYVVALNVYCGWLVAAREAGHVIPCASCSILRRASPFGYLTEAVPRNMKSNSAGARSGFQVRFGT